jgi:hypothetical protein
MLLEMMIEPEVETTLENADELSDPEMVTSLPSRCNWASLAAYGL